MVRQTAGRSHVWGVCSALGKLPSLRPHPKVSGQGPCGCYFPTSLPLFLLSSPPSSSYSFFRQQVQRVGLIILSPRRALPVGWTKPFSHLYISFSLFLLLLPHPSLSYSLGAQLVCDTYSGECIFPCGKGKFLLACVFNFTIELVLWSLDAQSMVLRSAASLDIVRNTESQAQFHPCWNRLCPLTRLWWFPAHSSRRRSNLDYHFVFSFSTQ